MIVFSDGQKLCGLSSLLTRELWAAVLPTSPYPCYTLLQVLALSFCCGYSQERVFRL